MIDFPKMPQHRGFDWADLHKTIGQIIVIEPCDSDVCEGDFFTRVWFVKHDTDEGFSWWLIDEWDTRKHK